jgi:hypothetical protein
MKLIAHGLRHQERWLISDPGRWCYKGRPATEVSLRLFDASTMIINIGVSTRRCCDRVAEA